MRGGAHSLRECKAAASSWIGRAVRNLIYAFSIAVCTAAAGHAQPLADDRSRADQLGKQGEAPPSRKPVSDDLPSDQSAGDFPAITLGGEYRLRGEFVSNPDFGLNVGEDRALLSRLLVHADFRLSPAFRLHVELGSYLAWGRERGDGPADEDRLDLMQGYAELTNDLGNGEAQLRFGRQPVVLGSARLVSIRESPNARRAFDGLRASWSGGGKRLDTFYLRPIRLERGVFDDATNKDEKLYGAQATMIVAPRLGLSADVYYLGYGRGGARFADGTDNERRHTVGMRLFGSRRSFDWDLEAIYQFGSHGRRDISAWALAADLGYRADAMPWQPRIGMKANIASGDKKRGDDKLGTFNALYPKLPYFTEAAMVAPSNIMDIHPTVQLAPSRAVGITFGANWIWRHRRADAYYMPPLQPLVNLEGSGRYIGLQAELGAEWKIGPDLSLRCWYVHFSPGKAIRRESGRNVDFLASSISWKF